MSSKRFEVVLDPAASLRSGVLAFSAGATLLGVALIGNLPLRPVLKALFVLLWVCHGLLEIVSQLRGMSRTGRLRISASGTLDSLSPGGKTRSLELLAGSLVLHRFAWLRFRFEDGLEYGELLSSYGRQDDSWRRLELIWRQQAGTPRQDLWRGCGEADTIGAVHAAVPRRAARCPRP